MAKHDAGRFWMVWSPQGRAPTMKHWTRDDADREALRLASSNPGLEFYVLKAVGGAIGESKIKTIRLHAGPPDDGIPF